MGQNVAILGASNKPERFSFKALKMLQEYGHTPLPVTPKTAVIEGVPVFGSLKEVDQAVDTLTMYVGPEISSEMKEEIIALHPKRVIFNPGSENPALRAELEKFGVHVVEACTLVLLQTGKFASA